MPLPAIVATFGRVLASGGRWAARNPGNVAAGGGVLGDVKKNLNQLGTLQDQVVVRIAGGPGSNMQQLFRLAAAAAFAKVKRFVPAGSSFNPLPPPGMIGIEYSATRKELVFILRMNRSLATATTVGTVFGGGAAAIGKEPVFSGPSSTTIGANWDFNASLPGLGATTRIPVPDLTQPPSAFAGKVLLTDEPNSFDPDPSQSAPTTFGKTKHLRPQGDARSRGGALVLMVTAALTTPVQFGPSTFVLPNNSNRLTGG